MLDQNHNWRVTFNTNTGGQIAAPVPVFDGLPIGYDVGVCHNTTGVFASFDRDLFGFLVADHVHLHWCWLVRSSFDAQLVAIPCDGEVHG